MNVITIYLEDLFCSLTPTRQTFKLANNERIYTATTCAGTNPDFKTMTSTDEKTTSNAAGNDKSIIAHPKLNEDCSFQ